MHIGAAAPAPPRAVRHNESVTFDHDRLERAKRLIGGAAAVTVLTGAGISTGSGIPDFRRPMPETLERVSAGELDPHCLACAERGVVGVLKSDTVSFGQSLVPEVIEAAMCAAEECDVLLAAGSSLSVFPAANVVPRAKASGASVVIINAEPTGMDRFADVVLLGSLGDLLPALIL